VKAEVSYDEHGPVLASEGRRLPVKLDRRLQGGLNHLTVHGPRPVWAYVSMKSGVPVCERIQHAPPRPYERAGFYTLATAQFVGLCVMATVWWVMVGRELLVILDQYVDI
jgi:hypothetical protein